MARQRSSKLNLLTALEVLHAADGDLSDGSGLVLRVRGPAASWVLRFTAPAGKRDGLVRAPWLLPPPDHPDTAVYCFVRARLDARRLTAN